MAECIIGGNSIIPIPFAVFVFVYVIDTSFVCHYYRAKHIRRGYVVEAERVSEETYGLFRQRQNLCRSFVLALYRTAMSRQ